MKPINIPQLIDEPPHFLLWSADEMAPIMIGLVIGIILNQALILTIVGLLITKIYRRYRNGKPDGYLLHLIYWIGLLPSRANTIPNPFTRRYLP
ncbi:type IV conjugative transfer system protein TraL [Thorsellia anophelis]|uniref:Conjugal transfer pilus assembly protein TraL n=1 Tax=Thorsellia anophelis DSM 18579 TaxID=1123402 RepID=A0A1I0CZ06_9GAMM|nr:type IV conjugative transfer system protein TraL [Thorsellia anophelis]SET25106.1 conjugal transfer pilus assembly protein TraL [Thorsellia anophelis DSM 18579]